MTTEVKLRIDFGNSSTRADFLYGEKGYRFEVPNRFGRIPEGVQINKRYRNNRSTILRVDGDLYCNGYIVDQEYNTTAIRPDSLSSKVNQAVTYISLRLVIAKVYMILSHETGVPINALQLSFNISALLPPLYVDTQGKDFENKIKQVNHVEILSPEYETVRFMITNADVYSEGVAAYTAVTYKEINRRPMDNSDANLNGYEVYDNGRDVSAIEVEENTVFSQGYNIVFDIGAGTTDVSIFRDFQLIERSKETFSIGGNLVQSELERQIREIYGFRPEADNLLNATLTGVLQEGLQQHDVSALVLKAKQAYSDTVIPEVRRYLERIRIDVKSISGILVCGGGAVPTVRDGVEVVPPMSDVLLRYLKDLAPYIKLLKTEGNVRTLNIRGLHFISKY